MFSLLVELPATRTVFETVYTSYDENQFMQDCSVYYEDAYIGTIFANQNSVGTMNECYYPEDVVAFSAKIQYHWSENTDYTPSDRVNYIAARMKEIYFEEVGNLCFADIAEKQSKIMKIFADIAVRT